MKLKKTNLNNDIYFNKNYLSLYLLDDDEIFSFNYQEGLNYFKCLAIKKPIKKIGKIPISDGFYDLESVYGYGGYLTNTTDKCFLKKACIAYSKKCIEEKIIAEFVRFHPFNKTHFFLEDFFDVTILDRKIVSVKTYLTKEERWNNYSSSVRNILRRAKTELVFRESKSIDTFISLYIKTMQRNKADSFYYFDEKYFEKLCSLKGVHLYEILYNEKVISSAFFFLGNKLGHYHLSANDYEYRRYNANYFILDEVFNIANKKGIKYFNLGGGRTAEDKDSLLAFKKKFSKSTESFYIAGKVFNSQIYNKYIKTWENQTKKDIKYFLKYRLEV